jgi:hypothetical protein
MARAFLPNQTGVPEAVMIQPPARRRSPKPAPMSARRARKGGPAEPVMPALPLPHERDEDTGQVDPQPHDVIRQAKQDLDAGQVDTDMRATPGLDAERREALVPTPTPTPTPTRRRRP